MNVMGFGRAVILLLVCGCFSGTPAQSEDYIYTVRPGDTIWDIAHKHLVVFELWDNLRDLNRIENPKVMQPGSRLRIPLDWLKQSAAPATIHSTMGEVVVFRARSDEPVPAAVNLDLAIGDRVVTGADGSVTVGFLDGSMVKLRSTSELVFNRLTAFGDLMMVDTAVRLIDGAADSKIGGEEGLGSRFEIFSRQAISAVRGTSFRTSASSTKKRMQNEVLEGHVSLKAAGEQIDLKSGFGSYSMDGAPPVPPIVLLDVPEKVEVVQAFKQAQIRLKPSLLEGADGYRLEIAAGEDFNSLYFTEFFSSDQLVGPRLDVGRYHARVRGVDSNGLEGASHVIVLDVIAWPSAPELDRADIGEDKVELFWTDLLDGGSVVIEVARDPDFSDLIVQAQSSNPSYIFNRPDDGGYFVRSRHMTDHGDVGSWGPVASLDVETESSLPTYLVPILLGILGAVL